MLPREREQLVAEGGGDVLRVVAHPHGAAGAALRLALQAPRRAGRGDGVLELERRQPSDSSPSAIRASSSSRARVYASSSGAPACQRYVPAALAQGGGVLHERDALPLDRVRDERLRTSSGSARKAANVSRSAAWSWPSSGARRASRMRAASPRGRRGR